LDDERFRLFWTRVVEVLSTLASSVSSVKYHRA
jgi:hypothetical protein